jgi:hypothetical protein
MGLLAERKDEWRLKPQAVDTAGEVVSHCKMERSRLREIVITSNVLIKKEDVKKSITSYVASSTLKEYKFTTVIWL